MITTSYYIRKAYGGRGTHYVWDVKLFGFILIFRSKRAV